MRELVMVGETEIGKTTLANALLGWDLFPQTNDGWYMPTKENASRMLTEEIRLTDTPGYDARWKQVPEALVQAVSRADTLVVLLSGNLVEEDSDLPDLDPDWDARRSEEERLLKDLLGKGRTRDIFFVLPFDSGDWPEEQESPDQGLRLARARFAAMTDHGEQGFFCVDPKMALVGEIEADQDAIARSGLPPLKAALLTEKT